MPPSKGARISLARTSYFCLYRGTSLMSPVRLVSPFASWLVALVFLLFTEFIEDVLPLLPNLCHHQDYERSMFPRSAWFRRTPPEDVHNFIEPLFPPSHAYRRCILAR